MFVKEVMKTEVQILKKGMTHRQAAEFLLKNKISGAPVIDEHSQLIGLVSEKDIFKAIYPSYRSFYESPELYLDWDELEKNAHAASDKKVEDFMAERLITTTPETPILKVGGLMVATGIHRVPVVDIKGNLVGMVSRGDIYRAILREHFGLWEKKNN